ncbi:MAG: PH domain-containing protein [Candidatus Micrarchaeales archaeon]
MVGHEQGIILNLLPDEKILYKTRAGRLSFLKFLPGPTIIATDKRLFIFNPLNIFANYSSFFYDKISAVDIKRGLLSSKFIIRVAGSDQTKGVVTFYKAGLAVAMFSIVSNQIAASKDPHHHSKADAEVLDSRYNVLTKAVATHVPEAGSVFSLSRFARGEPAIKPGLVDKIKERQKIELHLVKAQMQRQNDDRSREDVEIVEPILSSAPITPKLSPAQTVRTKATDSVIAVTQKLHKHFTSPKRLHPEKIQINYFAAGEAFKQESRRIDISDESVVIQGDNSVQVQKQKGGRKPKMNPDRDLKIFRVRQMRGQNISNGNVEKKKVNPFNIFNSEQ